MAMKTHTLNIIKIVSSCLLVHVFFVGCIYFADAFTASQQQLRNHHHRHHNHRITPRRPQYPHKANIHIKDSCPLCVFSKRYIDGDHRTLKISEMLWRMTMFFSSMVDDDAHRFYYLCLPQSSERIHNDQFPIRDLGAAWDATTALLFWDFVNYINNNVDTTNTNDDPEYAHVRERLGKAICNTLQVYSKNLVPLRRDEETSNSSIGATEKNGGGLAILSDVLGEPSNIAHSGILLLATIGAMRLSLLNIQNDDATTTMTTVQGLTRGILSMQRSDGAFAIQFFHSGGGVNDDGNIYRGIDFYPGEAMVALMDVYQYYSASQESTSRTIEVSSSSSVSIQSQEILTAMNRAFPFYYEYYKTQNPDVNYNIWQVQAFARLFHALCESNDNDGETTTTSTTAVANYVLELCTDIVDSISWKHLYRGKSFYHNLKSVEIACGLDALAQGISVASVLLSRRNNQQPEDGDDDDSRLTRFLLNADNAVDYLKSIQDSVSSESIGYGGLGYGGLQSMEQRLDVTGHAISALVKLHGVQMRDKSTAQL